MSQLVDYVDLNTLNNSLEDYVTKDHLIDELTKLSEQDKDFVFNIDTSNFLTKDDYKDIKAYIDEVSSDFVTFNDVYTKEYISNNYVSVVDIDKYYTGAQCDSKYLSKDEGDGLYLTIDEAQRDYLLKEDYRGIKAAMTLNSAYKNSKEVFERLLSEGKLYDGFYFLGDAVVIVKDKRAYKVDLVGDTSYSKEDIDDMNLASKQYVHNWVINYLEEQYKPKWTIDTGGNY